VQGSAYGRPVMENSSGIVFASAGGMNQIFLRVPRELQQQAIEQSGRFDPTHDEDRIELPAFGQRWITSRFTGSAHALDGHRVRDEP
jgi:hypothetical protein